VTTDTCWYATSPVQQCSPQEVQWEINSLGQYEVGASIGDVVGATKTRVEHYRSQGLTPCECLIQQEMGMAVSSAVNSLGYEPYKTNTLSAETDQPAVDDVTNQRDSNAKTKQCSAFPC